MQPTIDAGPDAPPSIVVPDIGYDGDAKWAIAPTHGAGHPIQFKPAALRYRKTARNFRSIAALAATFVSSKSLHTTY